MKVPPKKPHFFKPIQPGFKNGLRVPVGFLKYLKGYEQHEHAVLRRAGKKWQVKVNGYRLEEGNWEEFIEEHDLQLGDVLVFRHEGNMEFEVSIFDSTHGDREYAEYMQIKEEEEEEENEDEDENEDEEEGGGETSKKFEFNDEPNPCMMSSSMAFPAAEEASTHFVFTVKPYCLTNGYLRLPKRFVLENGLFRTCDVIIRDERQRSWNLRLTTYGSQVYVLGGWSEFRVANGLKVGDHRMFEVVTNGEKPVWKFHEKPSPGIRSSNKSFPHAEAATYKRSSDKPSPCIRSPKKSFPHAEAAMHKPFGYSHFVCTIRPYCLSYDLLCIPRGFARANGLMNKKCDLIIRDERQRSWSLRLCYFGTGVCIKGRWHEFRDTNCLKVGDRVMFEVVTNGEKPIWQFHGKSAGEKESIIQGRKRKN